MFRVLFPSKSEASKEINGEAWWTSDGKARVFYTANSSSRFEYFTELDTVSRHPSTSSDSAVSWWYFKINTATLSESYVELQTAQYNGITGAKTAIQITSAAFAAAGVGAEVVCVSVCVNPKGNLMSAYFNGYRVTSGIITRAFTSSSAPMSILAPEGVEIASVMVADIVDYNKPLRWWNVKSLDVVSQLSGEFEVPTADVPVGFSSQDSFNVEFETSFQAREGCTYPTAYIEAHSRHERNSVQNGTALVMPTLNSKKVLRREERTNDDYTLTLLDVGVETMTNVGGFLVLESPDELKRIGLTCQLTHVNYEDML